MHFVLKITKEKKKFFGGIVTSVTYQHAGTHASEVDRKISQLRKDPSVVSVEIEMRK